MHLVKCDLNVETGRYIKGLRMSNNLTQSEIARELGISTSAYSKIEAGITDLNFSRLEQIAKFFSTNVIILLGGADDLKPVASPKELKLLRKKDYEIIRLKELITRLQAEIIETYSFENFKANQIK
jgi:transcriptional regulator with XRE-family HTH domain